MLHPIINQMRPSPEQRPAILADGCDVVVAAGAGAGKTRTLVARYLRLLSDGYPLRSIVAITFTQKAAREMRNRVRREMARYMQQEGLPPREKERWQRLYSELDAARIGTIHSLCAEIARGHPAELGIDPRFAVLEGGQADILRRQALDEALSWAAGDADAATLFSLFSERGLGEIVRALLAARLEADSAFDGARGDLLAHWRAALDERQRDSARRLHNDPAWRAAVDLLRETCPVDGRDRLEEHRQNALRAVATPDEPLDACLAGLAALDGIKINVGSAKAWPGGQEGLKEVKGALDTLRALWRKQRDICLLQLGPLDRQLAAAMPRLEAVHRRAVRRYQELKDERNSLDFDDLEARALELLSEHEGARRRWQKEARAILVDEFQDTNARQCALVDLLNGGAGKLFVVGDAKQSIYAFRGADVSAFRNLRHHTRRGQGQVFDLQVTYRAHKPLVEALNALLAPVLGAEKDPGQDWREPFAPLSAYRGDPAAGCSAPFVELHLGLGTKASRALRLAADALAARLIALVEEERPLIAEEGGARPLTYGDVAVLCRSSASFAPYEDAFDQAGLPFLTVAGRGFYGRPEIRDLLNLLQAVADPTDDLALVGALRSPVLGLSDGDLYQLRARQWELTQQGILPAGSLWQALASEGEALSLGDGEAQARLTRARELLGRLHGWAGRMAVADLLKAFLDETDYGAALIRAGQARAARNVAKLLSDAYASRIIQVGEFLEYIADLRASETREGEARATSEGSIQIMTVHAAKGLEFPILVVGDVTHQSPRRKGLLMDPRLGVLVNLKDAEREGEGRDKEERANPAAYALGRLDAQEQEDAEDARLLYVAATRASERLILSGCVEPKKSKFPGWLGRLMAPGDLGLDQIDYGPLGPAGRAIAREVQVAGVPVGCALYEPGWVAERRARLSSAPEAEEVPTLVILPELPKALESEEEESTPDRTWWVTPQPEESDVPGWVIGTLVHKALARWRFPGEGYDDWARAMAQGLGVVDRGQLDAAAARSRELLARFREHPLWQELDSADLRLHEVPYSLAVAGGEQSGSIDLLYRRGDAWAIVEFKTDVIADPAQIKAVLEDKGYIAQARQYVRAVEALLGVRSKAQICLLDCAGRVALWSDAAPGPEELPLSQAAPRRAQAAPDVGGA